MKWLKLENYLKQTKRQIKKTKRKEILYTYNQLKTFLDFVKNAEKRGFSLLEVLFSIVILSIVMTMFLGLFTATKTSNENLYLNQIISSEEQLMNRILKTAYDQENVSPSNWYYSLNNNGDSYLRIPRIGKRELNNNEYRIGNSKLNETPWYKLGQETKGVYDDIDDFNGYMENIGNWQIKVKVYYTNDNGNYASDSNELVYDYSQEKRDTNIKTIEINATDSQTSKSILLYYNECNIGASKLFSLSDIKGGE